MNTLISVVPGTAHAAARGVAYRVVVQAAARQPSVGGRLGALVSALALACLACAAEPVPTMQPDLSRERWLEFGARLAVYADTGSGLNRSLVAGISSFDRAVQAGGRPEAAVAMRKLRDTVEAELRWLAARPPTPCFATAHADATSWLGEWHAALARLQKGANGDRRSAGAALVHFDRADTIHDRLEEADERLDCPAGR